MRVRIEPALRRLWRGTATIQLGTDPDRAVVIDDLDPPLAALVRNLDGTRRSERLVERAVAAGADRMAVERLLQLLDAADVLVDAKDRGGPLDGLNATERGRLAPDLAALALCDGGRRAGNSTMSRRRGSTVAVYGCGRVGAGVASLLAAAGVGRLIVADRRPACPADLAPGALSDSDLGDRRSAGVRRAIAAITSSTRVLADHEVQGASPPTFAVLAPDEEPSRPLAGRLVAADVPHLIVRVMENRAIIGPLVVPGETACLQCTDLQRQARDPAWPALLAQLQSEPAAVAACDVALASLASAKAAMHVLGFLAGRIPDSCNGTCEVTLPFGVERRRNWTMHPDCGCCWENLPSPPMPAPPAQAGDVPSVS